jgi:GntR family transcriptional regulator, transcriptional repressor for pyruvate dehydrogenase complex
VRDRVCGGHVQATTNFEFETIRKGRISKEVAQKIEHLILTKLKPGNKLPAERELAKMLGVSRCSLRDALLRLQMMGLVESRQGAGTVVREVSADALVSPLVNVIAHRRPWVRELLDFRKMLDPPLAARAAMHASPAQIGQLDRILERQEQKLLAGRFAIEEDSEFHYTIAEASGNGVVLKVLDVVMDLLSEIRVRSLQTKGRPQRSVAGHRRILDAIKHRDAEAAEAGMRHHIEEIEKLLLNEF